MVSSAREGSESLAWSPTRFEMLHHDTLARAVDVFTGMKHQTSASVVELSAY